MVTCSVTCCIRDEKKHDDSVDTGACLPGEVLEEAIGSQWELGHQLKTATQVAGKAQCACPSVEAI